MTGGNDDGFTLEQESQAKNDQSPQRRAVTPVQHPLAAKIEKWEKLREELLELAAQLETMNLMLRLQRKS